MKFTISDVQTFVGRLKFTVMTRKKINVSFLNLTLVNSNDTD